MNLLLAWPRRSINWNAVSMGKWCIPLQVQRSRGSKEKGFFFFLKGFLYSKARRQILCEISSVVKLDYYPLERFLCSHSKDKLRTCEECLRKCTGPEWSAMITVKEIDWNWMELHRMFLLLNLKPFDQMVVETDSCWVLALFVSLCGFLISFLTNSDAHLDFSTASASVKDAFTICSYQEYK